MTDDTFYEYEEHLKAICKKDCFYCNREDEKLDQQYKKAKKMGGLTWEDIYNDSRPR